MRGRLRYPLTEEAKAAARELAERWRTGEIKQIINVYQFTDDSGVIYRLRGWATNSKESFDLPDYGAILELARFNLVDIREVENAIDRNERLTILLLQELLDSVDNDFVVSDFFLTTSTVGTIINLGEGSSVSGIQSIAINYGTATQNVEQLSDRLIDTLGTSLLEQQTALREAIEGLRTTHRPEDERSKVGKVIEELGRCLVHIGNTGAAIEAIMLIGQFLR